jgi:tripartite-type tricarboxylate transporter receptor subunit TctC
MLKHAAAAGLTLWALIGSALAQDKWPSKPVTIIVPFAAGGNTDVLARLFGERLSQRLGQQFVVENRTGAGGSVGLAALAKSAPDGYTIGVATTGGLAINPALQKEKLSYNPERDFAYLYGMAQQPNVWLAHPSVPVNTVPELIAWLKANPGTAYGTSGVGSTQHICGEALAQAGGVQISPVSYRASNQTMQDLIAGQIKLACDNFSSAIEQVRAGKVRGIAVTSLKRYSFAPDIAAVAETIPGYEVNVVFGWLAPAGVPKAIAERIEAELQTIGNDPDIKKRLAEFGVEQTALTGKGYEDASRAERIAIGALVEKSGMKLP